MTDLEARGWLVGHAAFEQSRLTVIQLRERFGDALSIIAGGVHEPIEALELSNAGASLTLVDAGLVYSGPGLRKRINEAVAFDEQRKRQARRLNTISVGESLREPERCEASGSRPALDLTRWIWFWTLLLGLGLLLGGLLALGIASTRERQAGSAVSLRS